MARYRKPYDQRQLQIISEFFCTLAQSVWGGERTGPNDRDGDLYDSTRGAFAEVKGCCESGGAIIRKGQLERHRKGLTYQDRDYILGFYKNRGKDDRGKYRSLTCHIGKTKELLESFLVERTEEIYIVHISVVFALYRHRRKKDEREWRMKEGPRTSLKLRACLFKRYVEDVQNLRKIGLNPAKYIVERTPEIARFGERQIPVVVSRIVRV